MAKTIQTIAVVFFVVGLLIGMAGLLMEEIAYQMGRIRNTTFRRLLQRAGWLGRAVASGWASAGFWFNEDLEGRALRVLLHPACLILPPVLFLSWPLMALYLLSLAVQLQVNALVAILSLVAFMFHRPGDLMAFVRGGSPDVAGLLLLILFLTNVVWISLQRRVDVPVVEEEDGRIAVGFGRAGVPVGHIRESLPILILIPNRLTYPKMPSGTLAPMSGV